MVGWVWRNRRTTDAASHRQCDLFRNGQKNTLDAYSYTRSPLDLILDKKRPGFAGAFF
jgi:hypothetical protein